MKKQYKRIWFGNGLRTGLFVVVCFLGIVCLLIGCGSEDKLLSELRAESEDASGGIENAKAADKMQDGEASAGDSSDGSVSADGKTGQETNQNPDRDAGKAQQETDHNAGKDAGKTGQGTDLNTDENAGAENGKASGQGFGQAAGDGDAGNTEKCAAIYVHVCGAVKKPGVYELPEGSRFYEAVDAAGGFAEDACQDYLNMAALLADGSRLEIPTLEEIQKRESAEDKSGQPGGNDRDAQYGYYTVPETSTAGGGSAGDSETELVNINTADIEGLCELPGIGEGRAKAIIEYREKQGGFQKKEDIMHVSGIGEKMYARMEEYLAVE